jgi:undecaprenyl pyrophosphate phosphatase UppP
MGELLKSIILGIIEGLTEFPSAPPGPILFMMHLNLDDLFWK